MVEKEFKGDWSGANGRFGNCSVCGDELIFQQTKYSHWIRPTFFVVCPKSEQMAKDGHPGTGYKR